MNVLYALPKGKNLREFGDWVLLPPWEWPFLGERKALDGLVELGWCEGCHKLTYAPQFLQERVMNALKQGFDREYLAWCPWCKKAIAHGMDNEGYLSVLWSRHVSFLGYAGLLAVNAVLNVTAWLVPSHNWPVLSKWSIDERMNEARQTLSWYWNIKGWREG